MLMFMVNNGCSPPYMYISAAVKYVCDNSYCW